MYFNLGKFVHIASYGFKYVKALIKDWSLIESADLSLVYII